MTPKIEQLQNEIGMNLVDICPIPWNKIYLRAECGGGHVGIYYCFEEAETGIISSMDNSSDRFRPEWYKRNKREVSFILFKFLANLYEEYSNTFGTQKQWDIMTYIIDKDGKFNIDFEYDNNDEIKLCRSQWVKKYFGVDRFPYYRGLYPDTTDVIY